MGFQLNYTVFSSSYASYDFEGQLKGNKFSCRKCKVSRRCDTCESSLFIDYDNFVYEEEDDDDIETIKDFNVEVEEGEDIDYSEELEAENHLLSSDDIVPGFGGLGPIRRTV